jgi:AraC-like DNA-binding protein
VLGLPGRLPFSVRRFTPAPDLAWCVDVFWVSSWDVPEGHVAVTRILPHPAVNLTLEHGALQVTGVSGGIYSRRLAGCASVFGVKFRPGAFRLLVDLSIRELSGTGQTAVGLLPGSRELERDLLLADDDDQRAELVERWLRQRRLSPDPAVVLVGRAVTALTEDPEVRRVSDVATRLGVSSRTLQRLFADYVGVSPGWVLRRGRLHAAAERVIQLTAGGAPGGWADVAAEFGYADQAHFTRDFHAVLGVPPSEYASTLITQEAIA